MAAGQWDDFRYFLSVAKALSIKRAAAELGTTQSAVSKRLARLERTLNARLLERGPKGTKLTYQGERLLSHALSAEAALTQAGESAQQGEHRITGDCSMQMSDGVANYWLAQFLPAFFDRHPDVALKIMLNTEEKPDRNELFDVRMHYMPPPDGDAIARMLGTVHFIPFASRSYVEKHGMPRSVDDLANHRLLDQAQYLISKGSWASWFNGGSLKYVAAFTNQSALLARMVLMGAGIALMPTYMILADPTLVPLDIGMRLPLKLYASYRREQTQKPAVRATLNFLRDIVFDPKAMPWFEAAFEAPDPGWATLHQQALKRTGAKETTVRIAAE